MKKLLVTLLATATLTAATIVFGETHVAEVQAKETVHARSNVRSAINVVILRFEKPIPELGRKISDFAKSQSAGQNYSLKEASRFFSPSDQVYVEFEKAMADATGNSGSLESWHRDGVPVSSVSNNGKTKTLQSVVVTTGASAFVSVSDVGFDHRAQVALKIHQIALVSGTDVSPYFGDANARLRGGETLPMFWTNNGNQYCAFLTLHISEEKI
ncbi:UNVERIFIED_ORG: hypothetical protein J2W82_000194 [Pseudomonas mohnii]|nr:hypothetical protein [Pseudomonas mohnii]